MFVKDFMTKNPITISAKANILDADKKMISQKVHRLLVVDEQGGLIGVVTDGDIKRAMPSIATTLDKFEVNYLLGKIKIEEVMSIAPITIAPEAVIEEAATIMYKNHIGGLAVVDGEKKVVGIITETDVFKVFVDTMGMFDGKTRVSLEIPDTIGQLAIVCGVFRDLQVNIASIVTFPLPDGLKQTVVRASGIQDKQLLVQKLEEQGFRVKHIVSSD